MLIVNTASLCGFTHSNMLTLGMLSNLYSTQGTANRRNRLAILAFPSANFAAQEPKSGIEVYEWAVQTYPETASCHWMEKVVLKGPQTHELYKFLFTSCGQPTWNFTKYVCDAEGVPKRRFAPSDGVEVLTSFIDGIISSER